VFVQPLAECFEVRKNPVDTAIMPTAISIGIGLAAN
jgi:hypothetical protein